MTTSSLDQPVRAIARHDVITGQRADTLRSMAERMHDADCSALVIEQRSGDLGIVTERDIVEALATGGDPDAEWAVDVMTREVQHVEPTATVADVAELMQVAGIRHVLVAGDGDRLGIVSIRDLLEPLLSCVEAAESDTSS